MTQESVDHLHADRVVLTDDETGGLGDIHLLQPPGAFALTPASRIAIQTIGLHRHLLAGIGLDWGCGAGCLTIAAARVPAVSRVIGLDISPDNVTAARQNAGLNGVVGKTAVFLADAYTPFNPADRTVLDSLRGQINFILANPPSSDGDDGFSYRRLVLEGARPFLAIGGVIFLSISYQYGPERVARLCQEAPGFHYGGVLTSTDWVPFDLRRPDLLHCLELYAAEERRGGLPYAFPAPGAEIAFIDARTALDRFQRTGENPLTQWQTHLFRYAGA